MTDTPDNGTNHSQDAAKPNQLPTLPPDVLLEIFTTRPSPELPCSNRPENIPVLASSVCRYWRDVILATPTGWTNMVASSGSKYRPSLCLQRSFPLPFSLYLHFDNPSKSPSQFMRSLHHALPLHCKRLDELFIFYSAHDCMLGEILSTLYTMDSLDIRVLYMDVMYFAPGYFSMSSGEVLCLKLPPLPKLTFCKLPSQFVSLLNPVSTFPCLRTLWITDILFLRCGLGSLSERMPALTTLILQNVDFRAGLLSEAMPVAILPSLSTLVVHFNWHPSLSKQCLCPLGSLIAPNLEVLELGIRFMVDENEAELLEFHEHSLGEWRKPESKLRKIVFHGVLDPWHNGNMRIVRLLRKAIHVGYKGFRGRVLSASPVKEDLVKDLRMVKSLSLDYTQLGGQNICEALCRLRQMVDLLVPSCPPVTVFLSEGMESHFAVVELEGKFEGIVTFEFGRVAAENEYWNIPRV